MKLFILAVALIMYLLVILFQEKKVWFTTIAALIIIGAGVLFEDVIFSLPEDILALNDNVSVKLYAVQHTFADLINWDVILIYLGSMIISMLFIYSKIPVKIAERLVNTVKYTPIAMVIILLITGLISAFVENVATVLLIAPVALAICSRLKISPAVFLTGIAAVSNLEGAATLVGDPPSMIFASYTKYRFNDFFIHDGRLSIFFIIQVGMFAGCLFLFFIFLRHRNEKISVEKEQVVSWVPLVLIILMIAGLACVSLVHTSFEYVAGCYVMGLGLIGLLWYKFFEHKTLKDIADLIKELDWDSMFFMIGIFVVAGGISEIGLLKDFAVFLGEFADGSILIGFILIIGVSVIISGFVDNVPYILAMLPVAKAMALQMNIKPELYMFALLIGSCLGGNLTPYGASANIVTMNILKKEGCHGRIWTWLKTGVPFTLISTAAAAGVLWLLWK